MEQDEIRDCASQLLEAMAQLKGWLRARAEDDKDYRLGSEMVAALLGITTHMAMQFVDYPDQKAWVDGVNAERRERGEPPIPFPLVAARGTKYH